MAFKFQKRIKVLPGVRVNLSKSGVSTSVGGKGATVNLRRAKTKVTLGIPGTGLSHSTETGSRKKTAPAESDRQGGFWAGLIHGLFGRR